MASKKIGKKRSTITKAIAVERIDKMLPLVLENLWLAMRLQATLETGNAVVGALRDGAERGPNWYGAHSYNTIIASVTLNLALTLAKLFDLGTRRMPPNKRDVASIPLLLRLVRQKRCRTALSERARSWTPGRGLAEHEAMVRSELEAAKSAYVGLKRKYKGRQATATLKAFRDKKLAHSLIDAILKSLPRYEDLSLLLNAAMTIAAHLRLAINGENWTPQDFRSESQRQGEAFWGPAIKGVLEAEKRAGSYVYGNNGRNS